jgi:hypothetical protein
MPEPTPEAWAQIRHAYENTDQPLAHICAEHDITIPMMRYRMKRWAWTRRKPLIPRHGPAAVMPQEMATSIPCAAPPPNADEENVETVPRLQSAVARVLPAIEAIITRLAGGNLSSDGLEKAGRALGALTRTLRELNALLAEHQTRPEGRCAHCADIPEDPDAFREELARRIRAFVASREDPDSVVPGSALPLSQR